MQFSKIRQGNWTAEFDGLTYSITLEAGAFDITAPNGDRKTVGWPGATLDDAGASVIQHAHLGRF